MVRWFSITSLAVALRDSLISSDGFVTWKKLPEMSAVPFVCFDLRFLLFTISRVRETEYKEVAGSKILNQSSAYMLHTIPRLHRLLPFL